MPCFPPVVRGRLPPPTRGLAEWSTLSGAVGAFLGRVGQVGQVGRHIGRWLATYLGGPSDSSDSSDLSDLSEKVIPTDLSDLSERGTCFPCHFEKKAICCRA